jgi:LuxR family maltose regulon positive regulatory protein
MGMEKDAERYLIPGLARMPMHGISETAYCGVEAAIEMWDGCDASSFSPTSLQRLISFYPPPMHLVFNCLLIQRLLRLGRMEQALHHIDLIGMNLHSPDMEVQAPSAFVLELLDMTRLEYLMSERLNREAAALCERLIETAEAKKRRGSVVELEIALATLAHRSEDPAQALRHLQRAIHLTGQRRIVRPFLRRHNVLKMILANVAEKEWGFADYDKTLLTMVLQSDVPSSNIVTITHEPSLGTLTGREIELVRSIDAGLSNQQIADRFGISITTVKWHVSNVYSKLNVRNRCAAVAKARSLNLLQ